MRALLLILVIAAILVPFIKYTWDWNTPALVDGGNINSMPWPTAIKLAVFVVGTTIFLWLIITLLTLL